MRKVQIDNVKDTKYDICILINIRPKIHRKAEKPAYVKTLKKEILGYNWDIKVLGLEEDSKYFDAKVVKGSKNKVAVSSAIAQKYNIKTGDELILHDEDEQIDHAFMVENIVQYAPAFYVFMDIEDARELFGASKDEYNVVFSDHALSVDSARLYSIVTKSDIEASAGIFSDLMRSMVIMIVVISALIFTVVMYLMMKVMIDRSAFSISLIKVFGFHKKEVRKLYLDGNFFMIAVSAAICLPLSKVIMVRHIRLGIERKLRDQYYI